MSPVRVGLIDSGIDAGLPVVAGRCFAPEAAERRGGRDPLGHGSAVARVLLEQAGDVELLAAQVFTNRRSCPAAWVAAALDWLVSRDAAVVNMSFGMARPDARLREACERAWRAGVVLVGAAPARGAPAFPSAYPGCLAVSGDARCAPEEISWLGTAAIDFGAYPFVLPCEPGAGGGASFAAARVAGRVAALLRCGVAPHAMRDALRARCRHFGPERVVPAGESHACRDRPRSRQP